MTLDHETVHQQALLREYRRRLDYLLQQLDTFRAYTPHHIMADIEQAQAEICTIKVALRDAGVALDDEPNDDAPARQIFQRERLARLRALLADHAGFMRDRLSSFVGRAQELNEIRARIAALLPLGGYVTITGQAGQGKSSIIAKLVAEYGPEHVAHHFIPFTPGPDHQVSLLRSLMARLILKYDLPELYIASESRPALRDYFPKLLAELAAKGGQEVIFVDGLDQLQEDSNGQRDLSFLPTDLPAGIVFVLGTRPNDTLKPLELLKPRHEYRLPGLSRADFNLVLARRSVQLDAALADRFYAAMQANALYLDLVAKELVEAGAAAPEEIIRRVADNPDNLFTLAVDRLKRWPTEWREVVRPALGLLLATRAPLAPRAIRALLGADDDALRDGLRRLGGLLAQDGAGRYSLYHLKLYEYLRQDEGRPGKDYLFAADEEAHWHRRLAEWCERGDLAAIWRDVKGDAAEQERRAYARRHYVAHLYHAGEWRRLWAVLDEGTYGRAKLRYDPSTHAYAQDLDLGRQAATREEWSFEEALALTPNLWRYSLLRCSLASHADSYPDAVFDVMVLLGREQEAIGLAELRTNMEEKAHILAQIGAQLAKPEGREEEGRQILIRATEVAQGIAGTRERAETLAAVAQALAQARQLDEALMVAQGIERARDRTQALAEVTQALAQAGQLAKAQKIAQGIEDASWRAQALAAVAQAFAQAGEREQAAVLLAEAHTVAQRIEHAWERAWALAEVAQALVQAGEPERAEMLLAEAQAVAQGIEYAWERAEVLMKVAQALAQGGEPERAEMLLAEAHTVAQEIEEPWDRAKALMKVAQTLVHGGECKRAEMLLADAHTVAQGIEEPWDRAQALTQVAQALAQGGQLAEAQTVAQGIEDTRWRAQALAQVAQALAQGGERERAEMLLAETQTVAQGIEDARKRTVALIQVALALAQARQLAEAQTVAQGIKNTRWRAQALTQVVRVLAQAEVLLAEAHTVAQGIEDAGWQAMALAEVVKALVRSGQLAEAQTVAQGIEDASRRAYALAEVAQALVRSGQLAEAQTVAQGIEDTEWQAITLAEVAQALVQGEERKQAEVLLAEARPVVQGIQDTRMQAGALAQVAQELARTHASERLLRLVQQSWREAATRDYLLDLLPMANGLIAIKPNIGVAFAEAFAWVDEFLKG